MVAIYPKGSTGTVPSMIHSVWLAGWLAHWLLLSPSRTTTTRDSETSQMVCCCTSLSAASQGHAFALVRPFIEFLVVAAVRGLATNTNDDDPEDISYIIQN